MAVIGEKEIQEIGKHVMALMRDYLSDINSGYTETEKDFKVSFNSVFNPAKQDPEAIEIKTEIAFLPMVKIKDSTKSVVGEKQTRLDEQMELHPHRMSPRFLIDMMNRPHCLSGFGAWCTLKTPCFACEGRDHSDFCTFNERHARELEDAKMKKQAAPVEKKEHKGRMKGLAA